MRRAVICLGIALLLGAPVNSRAQVAGDQQHPDEYTQQDSHPLKFVSYLLAPIGFVLEWTVARPLHFMATKTVLAPALSGDVDTDYSTPAPIAELPTAERPTVAPPSATRAAPLHEEIVPPPAASRTQPGTEGGQPPPAAPGGQPVLH